MRINPRDIIITFTEYDCRMKYSERRQKPMTIKIIAKAKICPISTPKLNAIRFNNSPSSAIS